MGMNPLGKRQTICFLLQDISMSAAIHERIKEITDERDILIMYSTGTPQAARVGKSYDISRITRSQSLLKLRHSKHRHSSTDAVLAWRRRGPLVIGSCSRAPCLLFGHWLVLGCCMLAARSLARARELHACCSVIGSCSRAPYLLFGHWRRFAWHVNLKCSPLLVHYYLIRRKICIKCFYVLQLRI